jgi:hypothetical protein
MEERRRIQESEKEIERKHCQSILEHDQRAAELDSADRLRQKRIHANNVEYNLSLVRVHLRSLKLHTKYFQILLNIGCRTS